MRKWIGVKSQEISVACELVFKSNLGLRVSDNYKVFGTKAFNVKNLL